MDLVCGLGIEEENQTRFPFAVPRQSKYSIVWCPDDSTFAELAQRAMVELLNYKYHAL